METQAWKQKSRFLWQIKLWYVFYFSCLKWLVANADLRRRLHRVNLYTTPLWVQEVWHMWALVKTQIKSSAITAQKSTAYFGAQVFGSDIDGRQMRGKGMSETSAASQITQFCSIGKPPGVIRAAAQYGVASRVIDLLTFDVTRNPWRCGELFDAIVTDPPCESASWYFSCMKFKVLVWQMV